jgi:hypothetical protein
MKGTTMNQQYPQPPAVDPAVTQPLFKKKRFLIPAGVLVLGIVLGSCSGGSQQASDVSPAPTA